MWIKRWKIFMILYVSVIVISGCAVSGQENTGVKDTSEESVLDQPDRKDGSGETVQPLEAADSAETEEAWEKGYGLPLEPSVKEEAEADCKRAMEKIRIVYMEADKGDASNPIVGKESISQMCTILQETQCPAAAAVFHYRMENYEKMDAFLRDCQEGKEGSIVLYKINTGGGINRSQFIFDGAGMHVVDTASSWDVDNMPIVTASTHIRIKDWKYTEKGWFSYEYCVPEFPEVTEIVNGNYMLRVKPMPEEYIKIAETYLLPIGYQGNNLFRLDWDEEHLEDLDYTGLYEYLYLLKNQKAFGPQTDCDGIPKAEFEDLITEYLPVTVEELARYAAFDEETQCYRWKRLGPLTYKANNFSLSIPEVTDIKEKPDGIILVYIDAVCEPRGDDALIRHVLTLQIQDNGAVRYLGNQVLEERAENIIEYQYRLPR
ncbi:MAG: hypothetical protein HFH15_06380 [Ruminococcus sp.]|nr:hypothetical protein [Ruminococcus sp.]